MSSIGTFCGNESFTRIFCNFNQPNVENFGTMNQVKPLGKVEANSLAEFILKHYEVTQFDGSYALSMVVNMSGVDSYGRPLAAKDIACSEVTKEGFTLDTYVTQVIEQKNLSPLTMDGRARTIWQTMYDGCTRQLVEDYAQAVLTKNLNGGNQTDGRPERAHE